MDTDKTPVDKLRKLSELFNDEGVPIEATAWEENFICDLVESLILAEDAGGNFSFHSEATAEKVEQIYDKYQRKGWL